MIFLFLVSLELLFCTLNCFGLPGVGVVSSIGFAILGVGVFPGVVAVLEVVYCLAASKTRY
ncbi:MAG TPA: hypothetical protein PLZ89_01335, partial [Bacteroidales bacterium]|nr:hypothetical protein [Bacteroidales bacterium]